MMDSSDNSASLPLGERLAAALPGLTSSAALAALSLLISSRYGGPTMLYALLFGIAFNFLSTSDRFAPGINLAGKTVLRFGVALLGTQIMLGDFLALGPGPLIIVITGVAFTVVVGTLIGRAMKLDLACSVLAAGSVAICGASAALAISAVLPREDGLEKKTLLIIVGVTGLSTLAMIFYPLLVSYLGLSDVDAGVFIGATIHDVAQVVGAGYMISPEAGDAATMVKLMRVACLAPVVMLIGLLFRRQTASDNAGGKKTPLLPGFLVIFIGLVGINSLGVVPQIATDLAGQVSRAALITAVAAIGAKISLKEMISLGPKPMAVLTLQTVALALFALFALYALGFVL